jgi:hypothetical protein
VRWAPVEVDPDQWVSMAQAAVELGLSEAWVRQLTSRARLALCSATPYPWYEGDIGVTRRSLDRQVPRWASATGWRRRWQKVRIFLPGFGDLLEAGP